MRPKSSSLKKPAEQVVKDIRRQTRQHFSAEDKIRIVLEGLRGDDSIAELCRKEGIAQSLYYVWSKEFMEAGERRLAGDTARAATTDEVKDLRREASAPKECVADLTLENRLLKKSMIADGATTHEVNTDTITVGASAVFIQGYRKKDVPDGIDKLSDGIGARLFTNIRAGALRGNPWRCQDCVGWDQRYDRRCKSFLLNSGLISFHTDADDRHDLG
jgi:transposase